MSAGDFGMSLLIVPPDMDVIFALAYNENVSPVAVSLRKDVPPAGTPEADEILGVRSRRSSASREEVNVQNKE